MKNVAVILAFLTTGLLFGSCEKQDLSGDNSTSDYYLSKKGKKELNLKGTINQVESSSTGLCAGYFLVLEDTEREYKIEITGGVSESIMLDQNLKEMEFILDIEFLGEAYNCDQSFKKPSQPGNASPIEIQRVKVTRIKVI